MKTSARWLVGLIAQVAMGVAAHDSFEHGFRIMFAQAGVGRPAVTAGGNQVSFTVRGGERIITANGLPDHATGQFPGRGNPNKISAQSYTFRVTMNPKAAAAPTPARGAWS